MRIRSATREDIPAIVEMAQRFYPESPYPAIYGDMPDSQAAGLVIVMLDGMASHGVVPGVMLVAEDGGDLVGMLCLHIDAATFTPEIIAGEVVWWVAPSHRGGMCGVRLVRAGEQAAAERGATVSRMAVLGSSPDEAGELLQRLGYAPTETIYTKRLH